MRSQATLWIAEYIKESAISVEFLSAVLGISKEKLILGTKENLDADEFLKVCSYLQVDPKSVLPEQEEK